MVLELLVFEEDHDRDHAGGSARLAGRLVATRCLVAEGHVDVWDAEHRRAAEALALGWKTDRCDLHVIESAEESASVERLELNGDYDIDPRDLNDRYSVTIDALSNGGVSA